MEWEEWFKNRLADATGVPTYMFDFSGVERRIFDLMADEAPPPDIEMEKRNGKWQMRPRNRSRSQQSGMGFVVYDEVAEVRLADGSRFDTRTPTGRLGFQGKIPSERTSPTGRTSGRFYTGSSGDSE